jgi:hypothetical protein
LRGGPISRILDGAIGRNTDRHAPDHLGPAQFSFSDCRPVQTFHREVAPAIAPSRRSYLGASHGRGFLVCDEVQLGLLVGRVVMLLVAGAAGIDNTSITQGRLPYPFGKGQEKRRHAAMLASSLERACARMAVSSNEPCQSRSPGRPALLRGRAKPCPRTCARWRQCI